MFVSFSLGYTNKVWQQLRSVCHQTQCQILNHGSQQTSPWNASTGNCAREHKSGRTGKIWGCESRRASAFPAHISGKLWPLSSKVNTSWCSQSTAEPRDLWRHECTANTCELSKHHVQRLTHDEQNFWWYVIFVFLSDYFYCAFLCLASSRCWIVSFTMKQDL